MDRGSVSKRLSKLIEKRCAILHDDLVESGRTVVFAPCLGITSKETGTIIRLSGAQTYAAVRQEQAENLLLQRSKTTSPVKQDDLVYLQSVEAREGITTGISAHDRAATLAILGNPESLARDLVRPGHIFPVLVREGGVLVGTGIAEGVFDIVQRVEPQPAVAFSDLFNEGGESLTLNEAQEIESREGLPLFQLSEIMLYRLENEKVVKKVAEGKLPVSPGIHFKTVVFKGIHDEEHVALIKGEINEDKVVAVRVHSEKKLYDKFLRSDGSAVKKGIKALKEYENGIFLYLRESNRGKMAPHAEQFREFGVGAQIIRELGARKIRILTSKPKLLIGLEQFGLEVEGYEQFGSPDLQ